MKSDQPLFSIVIPVHNERQSVDELVSSIEQALGAVGRDYEILIIDDGSTDDTLDRLRWLVAAHPAIRIFSFRKNLGKSAALECGFQRAKGRYILTMDADLQDDAGELQQMYEEMTEKQLDLVSGWRRERQDGLLKVLSSKVFNLVVVRMLFGAAFRDMNSGLKLYKAKVAKELQLYGGLHRFIPLIAREMGSGLRKFPCATTNGGTALRSIV